MLKPNLIDNKISPTMPLLGKNILVTRPDEQGKNFATKLNGLGANAMLMPLIQISDPDSWAELDTAIEILNSYEWLLFASSNAVKAFIKRLANKHKLDYFALSKSEETLPISITKDLPKIAVIGPVTENTSEKFGLKVNYCPSNYLAEDFIAQFPGYPNNLSNTKILWPRTNLGSDLILEKLQAVGAKVDIAAAYKTDFPDNANELSARLNYLIDSKQINIITLASKQTAINLAKILCLGKKAVDISRNLLSPSVAKEEAIRYLSLLLTDILIVTIGPEASEGALNYLGKLSLEGKPHTVDGMIAALTEYYCSQ